MKVLAYKSDNLIEVKSLRKASDESFINNATVTAQLRDTSGAAIGGLITLSYVAGSNGDYQGNIADDVVVSEDQEIRAEITADGGVNLRRFWDVPLHVTALES